MKYRFGWVVVLALLGVLASGMVCAAPTQWTVNGHWYEFIEYGSRLTWTQAYNDAISKGGYLATLVTQAEDAWVYKNIVAPARVWSQGEYGPWLGGFQVSGSTEPGGGWTWVNGDGAFSYTNWNSGEPNNSGTENTLHMFKPVNSGMWNDVPDNTQYGFNSYVLEKNAVPEPFSIMLGVMGLGSIAGFRRLRR